jgi:hypothetical protein
MWRGTGGNTAAAGRGVDDVKNNLFPLLRSAKCLRYNQRVATQERNIMKTLNAFATQDEMKKAYIEYRVREFGTDAGTAGEMFRNAISYVPHLYRGGVVIRGFGFSTERIGKQVSADNAGDPLAV